MHDKETGNPHVHIMLTVRPLKENGAWDAKCRKAYDLDENGQRPARWRSALSALTREKSTGRSSPTTSCGRT
ncbi:MAG TPA: MobA/MobL family protein [Candidatus Ruminococcus avistercoris]|nr:MobA/MobL family protein [Candidatus Ruminococcus avistercoris]